MYPLRHQYVSAKLHAMAHLKIFITPAAHPNFTGMKLIFITLPLRERERYIKSEICSF